MALFKAILVYDGTHFAGFQRQVNKRTVQSELETALRKLGWKGNKLPAAGRTDKGVHAAGQVIAFDLAWAHSTHELLMAMNAHLPADVAVQQVQVAGENFHPRYDALARRYQYHIHCNAVRNPLLERFSWRVWPLIDLELLVQAAKPMSGTHDFWAFGAPSRPGGSTIRTVFWAEWTVKSATEYSFEVEANAFLYHMVRRMVRLQIDVAQRRVPIEKITLYLTGKMPDSVKGLAPPHGLTLLSVRYPDQK